jgi:TPR repeat protein
MAKRSKCVLIISHDEERNRLLLRSIRESESGAAAGGFNAEIELAELRKNLRNSEKSVGRVVLAYFDLLSNDGLGLFDYKADAQSDHDKIISNLETKARRGDASAQYELAIQYLSRGTSRKSKGDIASVEKWLKKAAKAGNADAMAFLEKWPALKADVEKRMRTSRKR